MADAGCFDAERDSSLLLMRRSICRRRTHPSPRAHLL